MENTTSQDTETDDKQTSSKDAGIDNASGNDDGIIVFPNPEKKARFRLGLEEYMPMSSSRILLSGRPGSGKRNVILNILHRMKPAPSVVHLVHCDPSTIEYNCINEAGIPLIVYSADNFPTLENIDHPDIVEQPRAEESESSSEDSGCVASRCSEEPTPLQNPLVIVDEITSDQLGKIGASRFERLVNHIATHRNTTVICSIQSMLNIPPKARRAFNHFALWKQADKAVDQMAASRSGIPPDVLRDMFELCRNPHDFIWVDADSGHDSPWRYRLNFISPITIEPLVPIYTT